MGNEVGMRDEMGMEKKALLIRLALFIYPCSYLKQNIKNHDIWCSIDSWKSQKYLRMVKKENMLYIKKIKKGKDVLFMFHSSIP